MKIMYSYSLIKLEISDTFLLQIVIIKLKQMDFSEGILKSSFLIIIFDNFKNF